MKKQFLPISLVYINNERCHKNVISTLQSYGGININNYVGDDSRIYYIAPNGFIQSISSEHILLLTKAGYNEINPIEEYTIEEIAKLLGKDPKSIRIKQ